jgi:hypothetical protein
LTMLTVVNIAVRTIIASLSELKIKETLQYDAVTVKKIIIFFFIVSFVEKNFLQLVEQYYLVHIYLLKRYIKLFIMLLKELELERQLGF